MNTLIEARRAFYEAKPRELRLTVFECRTTEDGTVGFEGYASRTNTPYVINDWLGDYTETIERGAFGKAIAERDDVRLLVNHDGIPIARTTSGTMHLAEDDLGLRVDVPSLDTSSPLVQSVTSAMKRGDLSQMSFAFKATRQFWNEDYSERTISEVRLFDVSVVTYPANDATSAKLRSGGEVDAIMRKVHEGHRLQPAEFETLQAALDAIRAGRDAEEQQPETDAAPQIDARARALAFHRALAASGR